MRDSYVFIYSIFAILIMSNCGSDDETISPQAGEDLMNTQQAGSNNTAAHSTNAGDTTLDISNAGDTMNAGTSETNAGTSTETNAGTSTETNAGTNAGTSMMSGDDTTAGVSIPNQAIDTCDEIQTSSCFSNYDCASDLRCQDVGSNGFELPCCVRGVRGTLGVGESCTPEQGQFECASALCIIADGELNGVCMERCSSDNDCPPNASQCGPIAFSGSDDQWCLP